MIDEVYLHESSEDKARKLSGAIKEKAKGSLFVANNSKNQILLKRRLMCSTMCSPVICC